MNTIGYGGLNPFAAARGDAQFGMVMMRSREVPKVFIASLVVDGFVKLIVYTGETEQGPGPDEKSVKSRGCMFAPGGWDSLVGFGNFKIVLLARVCFSRKVIIVRINAKTRMSMCRVDVKGLAFIMIALV